MCVFMIQIQYKYGCAKTIFIVETSSCLALDDCLFVRFCRYDYGSSLPLCIRSPWWIGLTDPLGCVFRPYVLCGLRKSLVSPCGGLGHYSRM